MNARLVKPVFTGEIMRGVADRINELEDYLAFKRAESAEYDATFNAEDEAAWEVEDGE